MTNLNLELHQMDVKTAFLNGDLDEEIYMEQPVGFIVKGQERKVCKLQRSIYGLKQSSRQWYLRFHKVLLTYDFKMIDEDHCVYVKRTCGKFAILSLYVDDILIAGSDKEYLMDIKRWLSTHFDMQDMGEANYILGVNIKRDRSKKILALSQENYIQKILERFHMSSCKPADTHVSKGEALSLNMCPKNPQEREEMSRVSYTSAVRSLMYVMMCTHPDICFTVGLVSRYQSNPGREHWKAFKRILRYLKGTIDYYLVYQGSELRLVGYSDADWGGDLDQLKSTSGYVFILNKGAISWCSKKQTCIALSTMEAEFIACSAAVQEVVWLRRFFRNLGIRGDCVESITVHCDNQAVIAFTKDPKYHSRTKHIDTKNNYIRDIIAKQEVTIQYISTHQMVVDPLTKPIPRNVYLSHVNALKLHRI